jgi:uncharacterized membrane protein YccC
VGRRRLLLLGLGVTALLVLAGIASNGRPLRGGRGNGPTPVFFDYVYTTVALAAVAMAVVFVYALVTTRFEGWQPHRRPWRIWSTLAGLAGALAIAYLIFHSAYGERLRRQLEQATRQQTGHVQAQHGKNPNGRPAALRWDEIALIAAAVAALAAAAAATRPRRRPFRPWRERSQEAVSFALDESLDDLRNEPDLRRAIIAAYARMERALAAAGLPRRPAEAPFEYIARALQELDTSAGAADDLTALFEWAKFSQHEPEPAMRDEAIEALVAVRDELRAPARVAA